MHTCDALYANTHVDINLWKRTFVWEADEGFSVNSVSTAKRLLLTMLEVTCTAICDTALKAHKCQHIGRPVAYLCNSDIQVKSQVKDWKEV